MRNLKKFLALVLATLMVVSAAATVSAFDDVAEDNQYAAAIDKLVEYGITNGVDESNFAPDNDVERYQMALFMARALKPGETDWSNGMEIFDDVEEYYGAIAFAYTEGIVTGIGNNLFAPHDGIRYQDALIMALRALGYEVDVTGDPYWLAAYTKASEIGLTKNVAVTKGEKTLTRAETAQVIYNMLKAVPADGGATIEEKNFGVAGANNVTTFVITATPNQAYADGAKAAEAGYVGIQPLVNGIPNGSIMYLPAELLGLDADEVDDYFNYTVDLVNYVEATGKFDKAIVGADPTVVYSNDVSVSSPKITVDGTVYYPSTEITGAALKNEIVVYAGGAAARESRILLKDADGDIINQNGEKQAIFAYTSANGTKYYADKLNSKVISETAALATYGVIVEGSFTEYETMTAGQLGSNYQLTMFDDDNDGKFERAIYTPVYMSVYNNPDGSKVNIVSDAFATTTENVKITEKLTKGDVFVYTYNAQLKKITVLDTLTVKIGEIENLNLTNFKSQSNKNNWLATVTIDGETYKIGNTAQETYMGANLCETTTGAIKVSDLKDAKLNYVNINGTDGNPTIESVLNVFANIGGSVKFIAYNGYIISAESYNIESAFDYMVVVDAVDFDSDGVYVDAYINGVRDTYLVSQYTENGKTVSFADLSVFKRNTALVNFSNAAPKAIYKTVSLGDGSYKVSAPFATTTANGTSYDTTGFKFYEATDRTYEFVDGVSKIVNTKETRLRTDASTKFYFINTSADGTISLFTGKVADKYVIDGSARIFADKLGYGTNSAKNGVAKTVVVYYTDASQIEGFNLSSITNAIVYIAAPGTYSVDSAANFGLTGESGTYFKYGAVAINMANGAVLSNVYATAPISRGYYEVDGNGIVTKLSDDSTKIVSTTVSSIDLNDQYITITPITTDDSKVTKLVSVGYDNLTVYTNGKYKVGGTESSIAKNTKIAYLANDVADGIVVVVVGEAPAVTPTTTEVSAKWTWDNNEDLTFAGIATDVVATTEKVSGKVYLAADKNKAAIPFDSYRDDIVVAGKFDISEGTVTGVTIRAKDATADVTDVKVVTKTLKDNVVTFAIERNASVDDWGETAQTFEKGKYTVTITLDYNGTPATFEIPVTIA